MCNLSFELCIIAYLFDPINSKSLNNLLLLITHLTSNQFFWVSRLISVQPILTVSWYFFIVENIIDEVDSLKAYLSEIESDQSKKLIRK